MAWRLLLQIVILFSLSLAATPAAPPHILVVVVDDFGYADVSYHGGKIPTPFLDSLSARGTRLSRYYTHTLCTPSRMSLLTGRYSHLNGFGSGGVLLGPAPYSLPSGVDTLPKELQKFGYSSHAVGKWHLGYTRFKDTPAGSSWGFESYVGLLHGAGGHYSKGIPGHPGGLDAAFYDYARSFSNGTFEPFHDDSHSTKSLTKEAIRVLESHDPAKPLFLYLAYTAAHTPLQAEPEWMAKCSHLAHPTRQAFCGLVVGADEGIRNVTEVAQRVLGENVIVVVTSDNGGMLHVGGLNTPLRGGKNMGYEGGVRSVGFVTDLSQKWFKGGVTYDGLFHIADLMPTLVAVVKGASDPRPCLEAGKGKEPPIGHGFNQWCPLARPGTPSPREDAVLVLDDYTNFVSYIKAPYKLMIGHFGSGEWNTEPQGSYLFESPSVLQIIEEHVQEWLTWLFGSREISFFWDEVIHIMMQRLRLVLRRDNSTDFAGAGQLILGDPAKGDVLASDRVPRDKIPVQVFNVWEDPEERHNLATENTTLVQELVQHFNQRHWANHPKQFNWALSCDAGLDHLRVLPEKMCSGRTSHLARSILQRSLPSTVPCRFEQPFVPDDDEEPCGKDVTVVNLHAKYKEELSQQARKLVLGALLSIAAFLVSGWVLWKRVLR